MLPILSCESALCLLKKAFRRRHSAETLLNDRSSRSHAIVTIRGESSEGFSSLHFVDLAGSECVGRSGATGETLTEAKHVNRSLSALDDVLCAIREGRSHIPYRNSCLTTYLANSIGGEAKMIMFLAVSPDEKDAAETAHALDFGVRARVTSRGRAERHQGRTGESDEPHAKHRRRSGWKQ